MATQTSFFESCLGVFQGGGCRGAAFAGAVAEASARGVNFVGLAGTSAGSIVAALLAAGATPAQLTQFLNEMDFASLILPPEASGTKPSLVDRVKSGVANLVVGGAGDFMTRSGAHSSRQIDLWLNSKLKALLPEIKDDRVKFEHLPKPVWIVAANLETRKVEVWSQDTTPGSDVSFAVRCSCSIPVFFQPVEGKYVDGAVLSNLPTFVFSDKKHSVYARRILAFTLVSEKAPSASSDSMGLALSIINTAVDGASNLQLQLTPEVHEIRINTGKIESTDFDKMTDEIVANLVKNGSQAAKEFFDNELSLLRSPAAIDNQCENHDEVYSVLTEVMLNHNAKEVFISLESAYFVYAIFPTLFKWRTNRVSLKVFLRTLPANDHDEYQRRILSSLGAQITLLDKLPFSGYLIDPTHHDNAQAVIYLEDPPNQRVVATKYQSRNDRSAIGALLQLLPAIPPPALQGQIPILVRMDEHQISDKLIEHVSQYARARLTMETVPLDKLDSLCQLVRGFKYHQVRMLYNEFIKAGIEPFECAAVEYSNGKRTIATPPVVEESGGRYILVQGTTRALFSYRLGVKSIRCLVVRNAAAALPVDKRIPLRDVLVAGKFVSTVDRYGSNIDKEYRRIEYATHIPNETLL